MRVQQYSGPVMAKGLEDTAFYRYQRFVALNEVGGHPDQFGLSLAASLLLLGVVPGGDFLVALPVAYATVYLGLRNPHRGVYASGARFSYGIYLYGFAVQQAVAAVGWVPRVWYLNFALGGLITLALAVLSYHLVEAPTLRRLKAFTGFRRAVAT